MRMSNSDTYYENSCDIHKWQVKHELTLSETERDVLTLSAKGYTMNEIDDRLCKSIDAVKVYKKALFVKLGVKNVVSKSLILRFKSTNESDDLS